MRVQRMALLVQVFTRVHHRPFDEVQHGSARHDRLVCHFRHELTVRAEVQIVLERVHIGLAAAGRWSQDRNIL
ncbi:hypothetical protein GCM10009630_32400 [Kribbella jejuensis]